MVDESENLSRRPSRQPSRESVERPNAFARLTGRITALVERIRRLKPVRALEHYGRNRGPLLAGGLAFQSIFALFAALWVGFSVLGLFLRAHPGLQDAVFTLIGNAVPRLIDTGNGTGAINPQLLLNAQVLGWTGAIALVGLLATALGWLAGARDAIRTIFDLPGPTTNFVLLKLKDLAIGIAFGVVVIVSAALSVFSSQATGALLGWFGIGSHSFLALAVAKVLSLALMFVLDTGVLIALYRVLSGIHLPPRTLIAGAMLGAVGLGMLKVLGTTLLGGASSNPLLASFAIIIGLLIWFNLICQVILTTAAWIAVGMPAAKPGMPGESPRMGA